MAGCGHPGCIDDRRCGEAFRGLELQDSAGVGKIIVSGAVTSDFDREDYQHYAGADIKILKPEQVQKIEADLRQHSFQWSVGTYFKRLTLGEPLLSVRIDANTLHITAASTHGCVTHPIFLISIPQNPANNWSFVGIHDPSTEIHMVEPGQIHHNGINHR